MLGTCTSLLEAVIFDNIEGKTCVYCNEDTKKVDQDAFSRQVAIGFSVKMQEYRQACLTIKGAKNNVRYRSSSISMHCKTKFVTFLKCICI